MIFSAECSLKPLSLWIVSDFQFCPLPFRWQVDFPHIGRSWAFHHRQSYLESRGRCLREGAVGVKAGWSTCLGTSGCVAHVRARNGRLLNYSSSLQRDQSTVFNLWNNPLTCNLSWRFAQVLTGVWQSGRCCRMWRVFGDFRLCYDIICGLDRGSKVTNVTNKILFKGKVLCVNLGLNSKNWERTLSPLLPFAESQMLSKPVYTWGYLSFHHTHHFGQHNHFHPGVTWAVSLIAKIAASFWASNCWSLRIDRVPGPCPAFSIDLRFVKSCCWQGSQSPKSLANQHPGRRKPGMEAGASCGDSADWLRLTQIDSSISWIES